MKVHSKDLSPKMIKVQNKVNLNLQILLRKYQSYDKGYKPGLIDKWQFVFMEKQENCRFILMTKDI